MVNKFRTNRVSCLISHKSCRFRFYYCEEYLTNDIVISSTTHYTSSERANNELKLGEIREKNIFCRSFYSLGSRIFFFVCDHQLTNISFACYTSLYENCLVSLFSFHFSSSSNLLLFTCFKANLLTSASEEKCCEIFIQNISRRQEVGSPPIGI